jgi:hypothetical protein
MSLGKKSSTPAAPTATFTPVAQPAAATESKTVSAEAQSRAASTQGAQSLLADSEEEKQRKAAIGTY